MRLAEVAVLLRFGPDGSHSLSGRLTFQLGKITRTMECSADQAIEMVVGMGAEAEQAEEGGVFETAPYDSREIPTEDVYDPENESFEVEEEPPVPAPVGVPRKVAGPPRKARPPAHHIETDSAGNPILRPRENQVDAAEALHSHNPGINGVDLL